MSRSSFNIHGVNRIEVSAYSVFISESGGRKMHVQNIYLYDEDDKKIGDIGIFLENPNAAMSVGDMSKLDLESYVSL